MEFPFDLAPVLGERFCVVDQHLRPAGRGGTAKRYRGLARGMPGNWRAPRFEGFGGVSLRGK